MSDATTPVDYRPMWEDLNLDLEMHDALLTAIPQLYKSVFARQQNRPEGMQYFDFVMREIHGLRVKELDDFRKAGNKVVGVFCLYVPEEIVRAHGAWCVGLCAGAEFGYDEAERVMPRNTCPLIKSFMGFKLARVCPYVEESDLVIGETTCDGKKKAYELLAEVQDVWVMELPQMKREKDKRFWRDEVRELVSRVQDLTGNTMTVESLSTAVKEVNDKRRALQRIAEARKADPVPISGRDALLAVQVAFYDDVGRFTEMVNKIADELEERVAAGEGVAPRGAKRILVTGTPMAVPNWKVHDIVEKAGGVVVQEELCTGSRYFDTLVPESNGSLDAMIDAVADKYLGINCACFTPNQGRCDDVIRMAKDWNANGIIDYSLQFCDPYQMESTLVERAAQDAGIPHLKIETDYSMEDVGQLSTRVEAFLEML
ncbi:MAG: double-cubane-cluster-containing anaerobic reductase [Coriobacteriia bacterium]|nr:double-cubane-cluster-containing anaerobic reductase [Coriobacteriia bacterium]